MDIVERQSIVVFFNHIKKINPLKRFGDINYISKEMHYLILYVNQSDIDESLKRIRNFSFVRSAYASPRAKLRVDYVKDENEYVIEEDA
jgi:uncharacterized protein YlbG (UPF0298 family)